MAIVESVLWIESFRRLRRFAQRFDSLSKEIKEVEKSVKKPGTWKISDRCSILREKGWEEYMNFRKDYQNQIGIYEIFSSLIQIFTLLGILGTVAGLHIALNAAASEGQSVYEGVGFVLSSTIFGIIDAVTFKILDILFTTPKANYIEDGIDVFEKDYGVLSDEAKSGVAGNGDSDGAGAVSAGEK